MNFNLAKNYDDGAILRRRPRDLSLIQLATILACDRRTDRRTDGRTTYVYRARRLLNASHQTYAVSYGHRQHTFYTGGVT